jgi:hypothetical protein
VILLSFKPKFAIRKSIIGTSREAGCSALDFLCLLLRDHVFTNVIYSIKLVKNQIKGTFDHYICRIIFNEIFKAINLKGTVDFYSITTKPFNSVISNFKLKIYMYICIEFGDSVMHSTDGMCVTDCFPILKIQIVDPTDQNDFHTYF